MCETSLRCSGQSFENRDVFTSCCFCIFYRQVLRWRVEVTMQTYDWPAPKFAVLELSQLLELPAVHVKKFSLKNKKVELVKKNN